MHFLFNYPLSFKSATSIIHGLWATKRARRSSIFALLPCSPGRASPLFFSSFKFIFMMLAQIITFYTFRQGGRLSLSLFTPSPRQALPFFRSRKHLLADRKCASPQFFYLIFLSGRAPAPSALCAEFMFLSAQRATRQT